MSIEPGDKVLVGDSEVEVVTVKYRSEKALVVLEGGVTTWVSFADIVLPEEKEEEKEEDNEDDRDEGMPAAPVRRPRAKAKPKGKSKPKED